MSKNGIASRESISGVMCAVDLRCCARPYRICLEAILSSEKTLSCWGGHGMLVIVLAHLQVVIVIYGIFVHEGFQPPQLVRVVALNIFNVIPLIRDELLS